MSTAFHDGRSSLISQWIGQCLVVVCSGDYMWLQMAWLCLTYAGSWLMMINDDKLNGQLSFIDNTGAPLVWWKTWNIMEWSKIGWENVETFPVSRGHLQPASPNVAAMLITFHRVAKAFWSRPSWRRIAAPHSPYHPFPIHPLSFSHIQPIAAHRRPYQVCFTLPPNPWLNVLQCVTMCNIL